MNPAGCVTLLLAHTRPTDVRATILKRCLKNLQKPNKLGIIPELRDVTLTCVATNHYKII